MDVIVSRAKLAQLDLAFGIVQDYYAAASVVAREDREEFAQQYFTDDAGIWLALADGAVVGCVALRRLPDRQDSGEVKRMYVKAPYRGRGVADSLLDALEQYAREAGYRWLYLDTASDMVAAARFTSERDTCAASHTTKTHKLRFSCERSLANKMTAAR
jgi:N-acetylglutamate synthase-like GNAT family acetyltransferase